MMTTTACPSREQLRDLTLGIYPIGNVTRS